MDTDAEGAQRDVEARALHDPSRTTEAISNNVTQTQIRVLNSILGIKIALQQST